MGPVLSIAMKDLRLLWRDKFGMFWVLFFPLLMAVFFGSLFGGIARRSPIKVAIIDEDRSEASREFVAMLQKTNAVDIQTPQTVGAEESLKAGAAEGSVSLELASDLVRNSRIGAYIRILPGFGQSIGFVPNTSRLVIGIDPSRQVEAGVLQGVVMESTFAPLREMFSDPVKGHERIAKTKKQLDEAEDLDIEQVNGLKGFFRSLDQLITAMADDEQTRQAMAQQAGSGGAAANDQGSAISLVGGKPKIEPIVGRYSGSPTGYEISFPQSITWGIFGCVSVFAISLVQERTQGTYLRLRVAPITRPQILAGKGLGCFLTCCGLTAILVLFGKAVFQIRLLDPLGLALATAASAACFVGIMMFASVMGRTERAVGGSVWAINMPLAMLGGSMIPLVAMPDWMQVASNVSPVKWMVLSLEGAIWRGFSLAEMVQPCLILLGFGAVFYLVGLWILFRYDA